MKLYLRFLAMHLKSRMAYKGSFFFYLFGQFLSAFASFAALYFLLDRFGDVRGYTLSDCLLCASVMWMAFSLAECFFRGFDMFPGIVRRGEFDRILVRPRGLMFQVLCQQVEFARLGKLLQASLMLCIAIPMSQVEWTAQRILCLASMILGGWAVFSGLFMLYAALSFFTMEGLECLNCFTYGAREHGMYPLDVYGEKLLKFCTYVIPYALFQYYPLQYLIGRGSAACALLPFASALFVLPCWALWRFGVKRYQSSGS